MDRWMMNPNAIKGWILDLTPLVRSSGSGRTGEVGEVCSDSAGVPGCETAGVGVKAGGGVELVENRRPWCTDIGVTDMPESPISNGTLSSKICQTNSGT